jgi:hypothetical protein
MMAMTLERKGADAAYDAEHEFREHLTTASKLEAPGHNVEVLGGNIVVSPFARWSVFKPQSSVIDQLEDHVPEGLWVSGTPFKFMFPERHAALGPDIYVVDPELAVNESAYAPCESLALVAEITSPSTRINDLTLKLDVYGHSAVPIYLLFDLRERQTTVYSAPSDRGYRTQTTAAFGDPVRIPAPFDFELDTTAFAKLRAQTTQVELVHRLVEHR